MVTRVELPSLMHCYDEDWKGRLRKRDRKIIGLRSLFMKTVRKRTLKGIKIGSNCEMWKEKRFSIKFMSMIILILSHLCVNMKKKSIFGVQFQVVKYFNAHFIRDFSLHCPFSQLSATTNLFTIHDHDKLLCPFWGRI